MMRALFYSLMSFILIFYIFNPITTGRQAAMVYKGFQAEMSRQGPVENQ